MMQPVGNKPATLDTDDKTQHQCGVPVKPLVLGVLLIQTVSMVYIVRLSRTQHVEGRRFLNSTAVFLAEPCKFLFSCCLHFLSGEGFGGLASHMGPWDMLKTSVPGLLYSIQSNVLFIGLSGLTASTYQLTAQLKILTTALLSVIILGTRLNWEKWFALVLLTAGVVTASFTGKHSSSTTQDHPNTVTGFVATIVAVTLSAVAGIYIEKLMKESTASIWIRNIQFSLWGMLFTGLIMWRQDGDAIHSYGLLQGYNTVVWLVVACQAFGGICVAMVLKFADNIMKTFSCALAILLTSMISISVLHESQMDVYLAAGILLVITSTFIFGFGFPTIPNNLGKYCWFQMANRRHKNPVEMPPECQPLLADERH